MTLAKNLQASFTAGELAPSLHSRVDLAKYRTGAKLLQNWLIHPHGGVSRRDGLEFVGEAFDGFHEVRLVSFEASSDDTYVLEFGQGYMQVYRKGGIVLNPDGTPFRLELPYWGHQLAQIVIEQSNDVLTLTHPDWMVREIARYDHADWRVTIPSFAPPPGNPSQPDVEAVKGFSTPMPASPDANPSSYYQDTRYRYRVTAVLEDGQETVASPFGSVFNDLRWYPSNYNTITWDPVAGALFYNIYKEEAGSYGSIGTSETTSFRDNNYRPDLSISPPKWDNVFNDTGKYPRATAYFQQRRVFGGTVKQPQTTWTTSSGTESNFGVSKPARDNDAIEFTIAGRKNQTIRHYVAMQDLLVFTANGEWRVTGTEAGVITPTGSLKTTPQSSWGIGNLAPLVLGTQVLFVLRSGKQLRDLGYKIESDNYDGSDLTLLASHLFEKRRIVSWAYQMYPNSVIWCVMDDGMLLSLTYMREHEVWGWAQHDTQGRFKSVAVVTENDVDVPYFVVERDIMGMAHKYIERMVPKRTADRKKMLFVDSGLSYEGNPATIISGLSHLEGRTVMGLADGNAIGMNGDLVVTNGSVTLPYPASRVQLGLAYESLFESLSLSLGDQVTEGLIKGVGEVTLSVLDTSGIEIGDNFTDMNEHKARSFENYDEAPELFSGPITIPAGSGYDYGGRVCVRQRYPLPATLLSIAPVIDYAG